MSFQIGNLDLGVAFKADLGELQTKLGQAGGAVEGFGKKAGTAMREVSKEAGHTDESMQRLAQGIKGAFIGGSVAVGLIALKNQITGVAGALIEAQVQLDRLRNGFNFGTGGPAAGAKELAFVRMEANRLGLEINGTAQQYMKLVAASRGSALAGAQTRDVFKAIAEASTVMGLGVEQSERAFMAVGQMMSKGKVQAEELRGQLGEHLPGAFGIAARSMNMTEAELNKFMETGNLMAEDFLPKFAMQLRQELAGSVEEASQSMQASLNRMSTSWTNFKQQLVQSGIGAAIQTEMNAFAGQINVLGDVIETSRIRGHGMWRTIGNVAATAAAIAAVEAYEQSVNKANLMIYGLTNGVLGLNHSLNLTPDSLRPTAIALDNTLIKLRNAGIEYDRLREQVKKEPDNIYLKSELGNLARYIVSLREARNEYQALLTRPAAGAGRGMVTPPTVGEMAEKEERRLRDQQAAFKAFGDKYASPQQKMLQEIDAQKKALGDLYTPAIEAKIRAHYIKPMAAAAEYTSGLVTKIEAAQQYLGRLKTYGAEADKLTDGEKEAIKIRQELTGTLTGSARALRVLALEDAERLIVLEKGIKLEQDRIKAAEESTKALTRSQEEDARANAASFAQALKHVESLREQVVQQERLNAGMGLSKEAVAQLEGARLRDAATQQMRNAGLADDIDLSGQLGNLYRAQAEALEELARLKEVGGSKQTALDNTAKNLDNAAKAMDEFKKLTEGVDAARLDNLFDGAISGAGKFITALQLVGDMQQKTDAAHAANQVQNSKDAIKFGQVQQDIANKSALANMAAYGTMTGALKGYAKEGSRTYKGLEAAERVFHAYQLAMTLSTMAQKSGLLAAFTTTKVASDQVMAASAVAAAGTETAAAMAKGSANAVAGVANQAGGDPYTAFPRMAAMAAIMAALGFVVAGAGGRTPKSAPTNSGMGTVLGDNATASESLAQSLELLNSTQDTALTYSREMARSLRTIENNIGGFASMLVRTGGMERLNASVTTGMSDTALSSALKNPIVTGVYGALASVVPVLGGLVTKLFGQKVSITGSGIYADAQTLGDIQNQGFQGGYYSDVNTKKKAFGITYSSKNSTRTSDMDSGLENQFAQIFGSVGNSIELAAQALSSDMEAVNARIQASVVNIGRVDLQGLSGTQIAEKLNNVVSAESDRIAQSVMPGLAAMQAVGEGYYQTLVRAAQQTELANLMFARLGNAVTLAGTQGALSANALIEAFGGVQNYADRTQDYFEKFYTESERQAVQARELQAGMARLGLQTPRTREEFRALVDAQAAMGASAHQTYAALMQLAPAFDALTTASEELAQEAAQKLIARFTGGTGLVPALRLTASSLAATTATTGAFSGQVHTINRLLGDASSGTLTFGERLSTTTSELDPAQLAVAQLQREVNLLSGQSSATTVDIAGLSQALANVETRTFVATVTGVFEVIGERIKAVLGDIGSERAALREAAINMIGSPVMSPEQIRAQITASSVGLPSNAGLLAAQQQLSASDAALSLAKTSSADAIARANALLTQQQAQAAMLPEYYKQKYAEFVALQQQYGNVSANQGPGEGMGRTAYQYNANTNRLNDYGWNYSTWGSWGWSDLNGFNQDPRKQNLVNELAGGNWKLEMSELLVKSAKDSLANTTASSSQQVAAATAAQTAATNAAKQAQIDYIASLQKYSVDASRAVTQLGRLREETVRYYDAQKALGTLMTGTADTLRASVSAIRFDQLDPQAQLANLEERFNTAYSMALSTSGETMAKYGQELNGLLNPLLQAAQAAGLTGVQYSNLLNTSLARAEATATRLDANAPKDYQAESLGLLGTIDSTLAAIEAGALTADQMIVKAIEAGKDSTANGLRAVVAALTGKPVPAFATGGFHSGGLRMVGEYGPELEVTGPARIWNASQTAAMMRGAGAGGNDNAALVAELKAMRQELKVAMEQTMVNTGALVRQNTRWDIDGVPVRSAAADAELV